jgi:hypothetical protein
LFDRPSRLVCSFYLKVPPQYPNIHYGPSVSSPVAPSVNAPRIGFNIDSSPKVPYHDPFPQVPNSNDLPAAPSVDASAPSDNADFDELARRFEDLKKRK